METPMIEKLSIKNFKSIKELDIDCKRINLFIGEPNTGKSNILESLSLLSWRGHLSADLSDFVRLEESSNLFYDNSLEKKIEIEIKQKLEEPVLTEITFSDDKFRVECKSKTWERSKEDIDSLSLDYSGVLVENKPHKARKLTALSFLKYYKFIKQANFSKSYTPYLSPPYGDNLFAMAMSNKEINDRIGSFFDHLDLKVMLRSRERTFEVVKQIENKLISYPYSSTSDTLQRLIFYTIAMESNTEASLIFEEPESFSFPYYIKFLGERIAFDDSNQYFISTHNPYIILAVMEKAPQKAVNVFITYWEDYQTKVRRLSEQDFPKFMEGDPFFNLGFFLEEK